MLFTRFRVHVSAENYKQLIFAVIKGAAFSVYVGLSFLSAFGLVLIILSTCAGTIRLIVFEKIHFVSKVSFAQEHPDGLNATCNGEETAENSYDSANLYAFLVISVPGLLACICIVRNLFMESASDEFHVERTEVREVGQFTVLLNFSRCVLKVAGGRSKAMCARSRIQ